MRGRIWPAAVAAVVVVLAVVAVVLLTRDDESPQAQCRLVTPPSTAPVNDTTTVRITEQGYTEVRSPGSTTVTIGAVLENPSDRVAYRTRVTFDVLGPVGASVVNEVFRRFQTLEVPLILPGAKVPIGDSLGLARSTTANSVSIKPVVTRWLPAGDGNDGLAPVTTTLVPEKTTRDADGSGVITYNARSANCTDLVSRGSSYILRDPSGKLIGGGVSNDPEGSGCDTSENRYTNTFNTALRSIPQQADLPKTEVASLCDLSPRPTTTSTDAPIN
ncbi:hypothetical protein [Pseudosporangium ferrugineum]|uniref:Uncharacterized protein n=1 Tax=Pseudosporangium ferrugineum TaxID=439699 RepID=A0A2T0S6D3_9ACTN|nr:hypothetical protein [Pseudosporangium ferrugineum]PRY28970.1 hypothetical protein CLV70_107278 [Pseudosporangium ferrugineum]